MRPLKLRPLSPFALAIALAITGAAAGLLACNAIIGVTDVEKESNPRSDGGSSSGEPDVPLPDGRPDTPDGDPPTVNHGELAMGWLHGCARKANGTVLCFGENGAGQLGDGVPFGGTRDPVPTPQPVPGIDDATSIASGMGSFTCVVRQTGKVSCWGINGFGQLGNDTTERSSSPVEVIGLSGATRVALGISFTCAVREDKKVMCWGIAEKGQLGDEAKVDRHVATEVPNVSKVEAIALGQEHACVVITGGDVMCWGENTFGQLGVSEATTPRPTAVKVPTLAKIVQVAAGAKHTCARNESGQVFCWGDNTFGQLGQGSLAPALSSIPLSVPGATDAIAISAGIEHTCAVRATGVVVCWGKGLEHQIGAPPAKEAFTTPTEVAGISGAIAAWAGGNGSCAMVSDGKVSCWGANGQGQLGNGTEDNPVMTPRPLLSFP